MGAITLGSSMVTKAAESVPKTPEHGIPLVIIDVDEKAGPTIDEMNSSEDHSVKCVGTAEIIVPDGYVSEYGSSEVPEGAVKLDYIRGRGNSTWANPKKPYKIKYEKKQELFGMGADKEWALMANYFDQSFLKNRITSWLSDQLDFSFSPQMVPVELVMKGNSGSEYFGLYYLSEFVSTGKNRLDLTAPGENVTEETGDDNITGDYLVPFYTDTQNSDEPASTVFSTEGSIDLFVKEPTFDDTQGELTPGRLAQRDYIKNYIQNVENLIVKPTVIDAAAHAKIDALMDIKNMIDYWWVQAFSINGDAFGTSSTYMYKKKNDKLYWGPLWDFDFAWGYARNEDRDLRGFAISSTVWHTALREKDPLYGQMLKDRWTVLNAKLQEITKDGGVIDTYVAEIAEAQKADREKWSPYLSDEFKGEALSFEQEVAMLKSFIVRRQAWINANIANIDKTTVKVTFESDGKIVGTDEAGNWDTYFTDFRPPRKEGYVFVGWKLKGDEQSEDIFLTEDATLVAQFIPESEAIAPEELVFFKDEDWFPLMKGEQAHANFNPMSLTPVDATDSSVIYSSSDESVAIIEGDSILPVGVGDTTITATTYNGVSASYVLHIYDPEKTPAKKLKKVIFKEKNVVLKEGETKIVKFSFPEGGPYEVPEIMYSVKDYTVCSVGFVGDAEAGKPGVTEIVASYYDEDQKEVKLGSCKVTVYAKKLKTNPIKVTAKKVVINNKKLKTKSVTVSKKKAMTIKKPSGTVTYKLASVKGKNAKKRFSINKKTGKIKIKKGTKKGTYTLKLKISSSGNYMYRSKTKTVKVKVTVK